MVNGLKIDFYREESNLTENDSLFECYLEEVKINDDGSVYLSVKKFHLDLSQLSLDGWFKVRIFLKDDICDIIYLEFKDIFFEDGLVTGISIIPDEDFSLYQIYVYNFFVRWKRDELIDWKELSAEAEKEGWIRACFKWTGIATSIIQNGVYVLDANLVSSRTDFYCLLGEVLFGYRGYIGAEGNALLDCLIILSHSGKEHNSILQIVNSKRLEEVFEVEKYDDDSGIKVVYDDMERYGFKIECD
ncbi:hypothetical protein ABS768_16890 [Flavobacterium sp. ST-75]|uniref:Barstar (Barnase inhibitor) n=1 Tax=Flavobacterium rhizophilum TaxID=3163296 RepID=A0ABW8YGY4_9FLAO